MRKIFNHRQNPKIISTDHQTYYISRANSVVAEVCLYDLSSQQWYILLVKRGLDCPDFQNYWCLPCGYLDWDETLAQAMLREVYEETGLYLLEMNQASQFGYSPSPLMQTADIGHEKPWFIYDIPDQNSQNLAFHFVTAFSWAGQPLPQLLSEPNGESAAVQWCLLSDAIQMSLAFGHEQRIRQLFDEKAELFKSIEQHHFLD
jgi:8-oxo-dGTP pyrophosphatase MutT (NUDIX family)